MAEERKRGRPPGRTYSDRKYLRLAPRDTARQKALAEHWGCSEAEAVRRALELAAKAAGVDPHGRNAGNNAQHKTQ